jgi:hypothetical protein
LFFQKTEEHSSLGVREFDLGIKKIINGKIPKAKFLGSKATIFVGKTRYSLWRQAKVWFIND